ncbi:beta-N-acetylhexosaminidase [Flavicella sediminum]|uniref:beta-N-acetylhexosaminidase n=1 Tax=Flavicella sediminum TaxID=2585141 RepID=UPI001FB6A39C|nr:family 20 glycosylhydrolase [Flavicella sediminum]
MKINIDIKFVVLFFVIQMHTFAQNTKDLSLMPWPQRVVATDEHYKIDKNFSIVISDNSSRRINLATTQFLRRLSGRTGVFFEQGFANYKSNSSNFSLNISYDRIGELGIHQDESYVLNVGENVISLKATTDIGVIYGLETLLQLVSNNEEFYYFEGVKINDFPRFTWRGLMIDVARHFQPVDVLKRNLEAMAAVKLNVFHWHLTDDQGFRVEIKSYPKLHELGSDGLYYSQEQIKEVVQFANDRGIRVIPEIDVPGHATAILTAYPEIGSKEMLYEIERNSGVFDPTLDPTNEKTYKILAAVFKELSALFPDKYVHIGGDENEGKHWDENKNIQKFKKEKFLKTNHDLQTYFNIRLEEILAKYGKLVMGWEEIMTDKMPTTALIHSWKGINEGVEAGSSLMKAAKNGYNTILSNGYYIDLMQSVNSHYLVDPIPKNNSLTLEEKKRILGGEATMWSELATSLNLDSRLWPRTGAIAERFWSSSEVVDLESMRERLGKLSFQLEELGITHIRNRDVILRNLTSNQKVSSLVTLTEICEPLKIYSRNKGGVEYQSYSPFTLFADACTVDAPQSFAFRKAVEAYKKEINKTTEIEVLSFFELWIESQDNFSKLDQSPLLKDIAPFYKQLSSTAKMYKKIIESKNISKEQLQILEDLLKQLKHSNLDVELAVYDDLKDFTSFLAKKFGSSLQHSVLRKD